MEIMAMHLFLLCRLVVSCVVLLVVLLPMFDVM